jgi:hypothetical protein
MKYEWKKSEKDVYLPTNKPMLLTVSKAKYFTLSGKGNPNGEEFAEKIGVLYSLAYAVRMMPRNGFTPNGYFEYTVYPLEGIWNGNALDKNSFIYTIMLKQPNFVDAGVFLKALEITQKKKPNVLLDEVKMEEIEDGFSVQIMHTGSYDNEPESFAKMTAFLSENGLKRRTDTHREIYLSDARKTSPEKLKTVLRIFVNR